MILYAAFLRLSSGNRGKIVEKVPFLMIFEFMTYCLLSRWSWVRVPPGAPILSSKREKLPRIRPVFGPLPLSCRVFYFGPFIKNKRRPFFSVPKTSKVFFAIERRLSVNSCFFPWNIPFRFFHLHFPEHVIFFWRKTSAPN